MDQLCHASGCGGGWRATATLTEDGKHYRVNGARRSSPAASPPTWCSRCAARLRSTRRTAARLRSTRVYVDGALELLDRGELSVTDAAKVKLFCTEVAGRVVDMCLQLHGGYGYISDTSRACTPTLG